MKRQNEASMPSTDETTKKYLDDTRDATFTDSYVEMSTWIRRVRDRPSRKPASLRPQFISPKASFGPYKWGVVALVLLILAGFIPFRDIEVLGHLIHAEYEADIVASKEYMATKAIPQDQVVYIRLSEQDKTHMVILLPAFKEGDFEEITALLDEDDNITLNDTRRVEEEINLSVYDAFFASLPASLIPFYSRERFDLLRFNRLSGEVVQEWLNTDGVSYFTGYSLENDTLRFHITAGGGTPIPTAREALFEEHGRIDLAIELLEGDDPRVISAREALIAHRDSLDALISGTRK